jgi:hypothetical protein
MLIRSMSTSQQLICQCLSEACQHHNSFRIHGCQVAINILSVREIIFYLLPAIFCLCHVHLTLFRQHILDGLICVLNDIFQVKKNVFLFLSWFIICHHKPTNGMMHRWWISSTNSKWQDGESRINRLFHIYYHTSWTPVCDSMCAFNVYK